MKIFSKNYQVLFLSIIFMLNAETSTADNIINHYRNNNLQKFLGIPCIDTAIATGIGTVVGAGENTAGQQIQN